MRRLQRLDLSNNQISRLGPFGICCAVRVLRLAGNRIGTLTGIDDIARTLTELDVSRNQLRTVHDIQPLSGCSRLTTVRLDGNPLLHDVPRTADQLKSDRRRCTLALPDAASVVRRARLAQATTDQVGARGHAARGRRTVVLQPNEAQCQPWRSTCRLRTAGKIPVSLVTRREL